MELQLRWHKVAPAQLPYRTGYLYVAVALMCLSLMGICLGHISDVP
jgi:hypothetical protein